MSSAFAALALVATTAQPCANLAERQRALRELAARDPVALEAEAARLGPFAAASEITDPAARAEVAAGRLAEACALERTDFVPPSPDRPRLTAILDRPEFSTARQRNSNVLERWFARVKDWLSALLLSSEALSFSETSRGVVLALALAVVVGGGLRLARARWRRRPPAAAEERRAGRVDLQDPAVHLALAKAALGSDGREAIRQALLCLLSALERGRLARPDRVKTNRELAAELPERGASAAVCGEVERLLSWYDRAFYSLEPVQVPEAEAFLEGVVRLRASLGGGG